ncbi:MAG TPA: acylphosphatase [Syntrophus sp. (in: bacteria)]|nr:acylphosphatase [Syntrophus sp. (in: bacteria)]
MKRIHVTITGRVQGVAFRAATREAAIALNLTGWVKNLRDGRVEAIFEGEDDQMELIQHWCKHGPPLARVTGVDLSEEDYTGEFREFTVLYG